jgi:hypothetical protein
MLKQPHLVLEQGSQSRCNVTLRCVRATTGAVGKKILHILSLCLQPLVPSKQCAWAISTFVAHPAPQYFSKPQKCMVFEKRNFTEYKLRVLVLSTTFARNICHSNKP